MMLKGSVDFGVQNQQHRPNRHPSSEVLVLVESIGEPGVVEEIGKGRRDGVLQIKQVRDGLLSERQNEKVDVAGDDIGRASGCVER